VARVVAASDRKIWPRFAYTVAADAVRVRITFTLLRFLLLAAQTKEHRNDRILLRN
jgi:hypothetical protein